MYNEKLKKEFLESKNEYAASLSEYSILFSKSENYEETINKDLCNWSVVDILNYYSIMGAGSINTVITRNNHFRKYADWVLLNKIGEIKDNQNHFREITREQMMSCVNNDFKHDFFTREELLEVINTSEDPRLKFVALGLFEGIKGFKCCELMNANLNDIHGNIITLHSMDDTRELEISKELIKYAHESAELTELVVNYKDGREYVFYFSGDPNIIIKSRDVLKNCDSKEVDGLKVFYRRIWDIFRRFNEKNDTSIGFNSTTDSGRVYYFKQAIAEKGIQINGREDLTLFLYKNPEIMERHGKIRITTWVDENYKHFL